MTVGELKKMLENVPDDLEIVTYQNGMEQHGILPKTFYGKIVKVTEEKVQTHDAFDYTDYTYTRFKEDKNGTKEVFYM